MIEVPLGPRSQLVTSRCFKCREVERKESSEGVFSVPSAFYASERVLTGLVISASASILNAGGGLVSSRVEKISLKST